MKKYFKLLLVIVSSCFYTQSNFEYKKVNSQILQQYITTPVEISEVKNKYFQTATDLTKFLPSNYDKTGKTDYTSYLQMGIDKSGDVILPDFPVCINYKGLKPKSNTKLLFLKNSALIVKANDKEFYNAINLENAENVSIYFAKLKGDRDVHLGTKGEWGMGIFIIHAKNISIYKSTIIKFWGDGIYIGKDKGLTSENIVIDKAFIDENRRNGISIIAGNKVQIKNSLIANTYGTLPEYGIDIEPNNSKDDLKNIVISNNITYNNAKGGVLFALDNLKGIQINDFTVKILNHTDFYSQKGLEFFIDRGYNKSNKPIKGNIMIRGLKLNGTKTPIINNQSQLSNVEINIDGVEIDNNKVNSSKISNFVKNFKSGKQNVIK